MYIVLYNVKHQSEHACTYVPTCVQYILYIPCILHIRTVCIVHTVHTAHMAHTAHTVRIVHTVHTVLNFSLSDCLFCVPFYSSFIHGHSLPLATGALIYLLNLFCNSTVPSIREETAALFAKMITDKLVGPKVRIALSKFLPIIFMDAMKDSPETSLHMFDSE